MDENVYLSYGENIDMLIDDALEMFFVFDKKGVIIKGNGSAKQLLGYDEIDHNLTIEEVFPNVFSLETGILEYDQSLFEKVTEQMAYRKNRTCFSVKFKLKKIYDENGYTACMAYDAATENYLEHRAQMADEQMESAENMKSQFVATVTHELRTPVNGILGNVKNLQKMEEDPEKQGILKLIERGCADMHSIINNILDFSKLDAGKLELENKEFNFREFMEYIKSTHINKIVEKGLNFFMNISPEVPETIVGDELRIGQILNNFISNATKFTSAGKISVEVVKTAQMGNKVELFFMVIDTGIGISLQNQDKLFKSFSQVDSSTFRKYGGTGLGLSISKQLVEIMDGNVHVESEENRGSMFSFHIWVENPALNAEAQNATLQSFDVQLPDMSQLEEDRKALTYGTEENLDEIDRKMSKLVLCIEMGNWEKAEMFMESIRQLTMEAPQPIRSLMLRLKMSVQKADHDKSIDAFNAFSDGLKA